MATATPTGALVVATAVFLASAVEMVEALTIVLAVGVTRGWRSAFEGVAVALLVLAGLVVALGPALVHYVPLSVLRLVVGTLLLVFGLQWLRKAILRSAGLKAKHDEDAIFAEQVADLSEAPPPSKGRDATAFTVAFKGVFLEGMEVVVIVITLGTTSHRLGLAAAAAGAAALVVLIVGLIVHRQLSGVPENAMKMSVGLMLVSFGTFWSAEGVHVTLARFRTGHPGPGGLLRTGGLVAGGGVATRVAVEAGALAGPGRPSMADGRSRDPAQRRVRWLAAFGRFWWEFLIGDTPELFVGAVAVVGDAGAAVRCDPGLRTAAALLAPVLVAGVLAASVWRAARKRTP